MWPARRKTSRASCVEAVSLVSTLGVEVTGTSETSCVEAPGLVSTLGIEVKSGYNIQEEFEIIEDEQDEIIECEIIDPDIGDNGFEFIDSDGEDEDVELTAGEIRMRAIQQDIPDEDGFYDCREGEIHLSVAERKERRFKIKRGITADSGAGDPVIPRRMMNPKKIVPSAGSRRGLHYISATDHRIPNVGEVDLEFETCEGYSEKIKFQVADVNKALMSISDRVDHRCRVVFDQDEETGEDISHIFDKQSRRKLKLTRVGKVWVLECSVTEDFLPMELVPTNNSGFTGPGR